VTTSEALQDKIIKHEKEQEEEKESLIHKNDSGSSLDKLQEDA